MEFKHYPLFGEAGLEAVLLEVVVAACAMSDGSLSDKGSEGLRHGLEEMELLGNVVKPTCAVDTWELTDDGRLLLVQIAQERAKGMGPGGAPLRASRITQSRPDTA